MEIRQAIESDAQGVARVHVQTWKAAYRGIVSDVYLDSLSIEKREMFWLENIKQGTAELWVAEARSGVVGWVEFGTSRDKDASDSIGELYGIYILPEYWSTGTGRALWLVARRRLIAREFRFATVWVLTGNARAIRFYSAADFKVNPATEMDIKLGDQTLRKIRYEMDFY